MVFGSLANPADARTLSYYVVIIAQCARNRRPEFRRLAGFRFWCGIGFPNNNSITVLLYVNISRNVLFSPSSILQGNKRQKVKCQIQDHESDDVSPKMAGLKVILVQHFVSCAYARYLFCCASWKKQEDLNKENLGFLRLLHTKNVFFSRIWIAYLFFIKQTYVSRSLQVPWSPVSHDLGKIVSFPIFK